MNQKMTNMKDGTSKTFLDLLHFTMMESSKSQHTCRDYGDAIKKLPSEHGRKWLEDMPLHFGPRARRYEEETQHCQPIVEGRRANAALFHIELERP